MKFPWSILELVFNLRTRRAVAAAISGLLMTCIVLLSTNGIAKGQCDYIPGDVNNYQGATALADVIYFMRYLYGSGVPPVNCGTPVGPCPEASPFYAACDVDGSCQVNATDANIMIQYYKRFLPQLYWCPDCPPAPDESDNDPLVDGSGKPPAILTDPGSPDEVVLGNLDGSPINVELGEVVYIPVWVRNDEQVPALTMTFETVDQFVTPGGGNFLEPLNRWYDHSFLAPETNHPAPGLTTQTIYGYNDTLGSGANRLYTNGAYLQIATFIVTVNINQANVGQSTDIVFGAGSHVGPTAFCDAAGIEEWNPICRPATLYIVPGNFSIIVGKVFYDVDDDCVQDQDEIGLHNWIITAEPGGYSTLTDGNGHYFIADLPPNTYTVSEVLQTNWGQSCPSNPGTYTVVLGPNQVVNGIIFGDTTIGPVRDLACHVGGGLARPGFYKAYGITCCNYGPLVSDATVILTLPPEVEYSSCIPLGCSYDINTHTVSWSISGLIPGGCVWLQATVLVPSTVPLGTMLTANAEIITLGGDINPANNLDTETQIVRGSWDPNEKLVTPEGEILRTDKLTYQINFQNVGTDTAFTVVVRDTLDPNLDISTFTTGASIHPYTYAFTGREISWTFADINLPDSFANEAASHGFVKFTAFPLPSVPPGTIIENRASIFFDFNPAVVTNTVSNQIASTSGCSYVAGDVNGSGNFDGIDVGMAVNFFKGATLPPAAVRCPPCSTLGLNMYYPEGDANGTCNFDGIDIGYMVNHFKYWYPPDGPYPTLYCPQCPPAGLNPPTTAIQPSAVPVLKAKGQTKSLD